MQKYAKLTEGKIEFAPQNKGSISNYNLSVELMTADGYKPLVIVEETSAEKPLVKYRETDKQIEQYAEALTVREKKEQIRQQRQSRFRIEADPLKLDYDEAVARGEDAEKARIAWLAKKDLIRSELPYIEE